MMRARARPCPRDERDGWRRKHDINVRISKSTKHEVCLVGASLIGNLARCSHVWRRFFGGTLRAVNFGIGGDRSQHALWRVINGEIPPTTRCVTVNIGNNNIPRDPPCRIADDIIAIGQRFKEALPEGKVLLVGLLPRDEGFSSRRDRQQEINIYLNNFCQRHDSEGFFYLPPEKKFVPGTDGQLDRKLFHTDFLHLSDRGNELFAKSIADAINNILHGSWGRGNPTLDSFAIGQPESIGAIPPPSSSHSSAPHGWATCACLPGSCLPDFCSACSCRPCLACGHGALPLLSR